MLAEFGFGVLVLAFVVALYSAGAAAFGSFRKSFRWVESARRGMQLTFPLITIAAGTLIILLASGHFELQYVFSVTSRDMPLYLKITALWGGQAGSLLFWSWLMSAFASAVTLRKWDRDREFLPWVVVVTAVTLAFFLAMNIFFRDENPFARLWQSMNGDVTVAMFQPAGTFPKIFPDGNGLNPLLRHPGMIIHPPMLYLGFVAFVIPYAFAMAALITGRTDDRWIRITRRWTLVAWLFLSCGLVLGMRWAYDVLGWGGYWGWDPVEIAALLPWLAGTPFLHTVIIQEKRGMFKQLNMFLIIMTYVLVIFGTFLTRSGVLSSVHAFAQSAIGPMFFAFIGISLIASFALLIHRWNDLKSESSLGKTSLFSREALFLLAALLFGGFFIVCFWGILYPLIYEIISGQKITFGPAFYRGAVAPILGSLMLLMGVAPLSSWTYGTIKTIGRSIWKPAIPTGITAVVLFFLMMIKEMNFGLGNWIALIGFTLIAFVIFVALYEFWRSWGKSLFKKSWRTLWMPLIPSAIILGVLIVLGVHDWITLVWRTVLTFVIFVALFDIWRAWGKSVNKKSWRALWPPLMASAVLLAALFFLVVLTILGLQNWIATAVSLVLALLGALGQSAMRNRRRYGGYLIHIAMVIMALGIIGIEVFQTTTQKSLAVGESLEISGYSIRFDSLAQFPASDGRWVTRAVMSVSRDGKYLGELHPRYDLYPDGQPMTIPAVRSTLVDDLYVVLVNWENISQAQAPFKVYHNPLVIWLWIGSFVFIGGILVAAWPEREDAGSEK